METKFSNINIKRNFAKKQNKLDIEGYIECIKAVGFLIIYIELFNYMHLQKYDIPALNSIQNSNESLL